MISIEHGSCFAVGEHAGALNALKAEIAGAWERLGATPVWLAPTCGESPHPLAVRSEHTRGRLVHAACLSFFERLGAFPGDGLYGGFCQVHRLEPLAELDSLVRLETFTVAETIIVGDARRCRELYAVYREAITALVGRHVPTARWSAARDLFAPGLRAKEELWAQVGGLRVAVASGNDHGDAFTNRAGVDGESRCFGIGIERLYAAAHATS